MAGKSNDIDSNSETSLGLANVSVSGARPHLEQWTLPHEWNIEHREGFGSWKHDVQSQVQSLGSQLNQSFSQFPPETLSSGDSQRHQRRQRYHNTEDMFHGPRLGKPGPFM